MVYKKRCLCGYVASATSVARVAEAVQAHCEHTGHDAIQVRNA